MAFVQPNPDGPEGEPMVALFELGARRAADAVRNGEQTAEALVEALLAHGVAAQRVHQPRGGPPARRGTGRRPAASARRAAGAAAWGAARAQGQHRYGRFSDNRRNARAASTWRRSRRRPPG